MVQKVQVVGSDGRTTKTDTPSGISVSMTDDHARMHDGKNFITSLYSAALSAAAALVMHVKVAAGKRVHLRVRGEPNQEAVVAVYEGPTTSADGTAVTPRNRDRASSAVPATGFFSGPTVSANGTLVEQYVVSRASSGGPAAERELYLKPSTNYLVSITNLNGSSQPTSLSLDFYESDA